MSTGWTAVLWLHLLAMAFFVGGQLMLAAVIMPVLRDGRDPERIRRVARRFGAGSLIALAVLLVTGVAMASQFSLWSSGTLQLKLALVVIVIVLTLVHLRLPRGRVLHGLIFLTSLAIVWLGLELTR